jgi:hypothetical protein
MRPYAPWSVQWEYEQGRNNGIFPPVDRASMRLAGSSLSSVANLPASASAMAVSQAAELFFHYLDGVATKSSLLTVVIHPCSGEH